jgi:succinate dehydrogenase/fumarate reductase flavoprotein subunit
MAKKKDEEKKSLSRREFLKDTGMVVGGAALTMGALSLAGCASPEAETTTVTGPGTTVTTTKTETATPWLPSKWDYEADVVVVGYGGAGAATAITAHDAGVKVLMLEKAPEQFKGGNTKVSGNAVFCPNDIEKAIIYFKAMCGYYTDNLSEEMIHVWAEEMYNTKTWMESLGADLFDMKMVEFPELPGSECASVFLQRSGPIGQARLWNEVIEPAVAARNIQILYETPAIQLISNCESEIVGVVAEENGREINIRAKRATVLTCGGFENDPTLVRTYLSDLPYCYPMGTPYNTGDGVRMAQKVGADLWHMNNIAGPYFYFKVPDYAVSSRVLMPGNNYIYVAKDGTRFTREGPTIIINPDGTQTYVEKHGKIYSKGRWLQNPAPVPIYVVFDETTRKAGGICGAAAGYTWSWDVIYDTYKWSNDNIAEINKGWIKRGDTIGSLASQVGLSQNVLEATVQRYNGFCSAGEDLDFNRSPASLKPIETPPFYIMELTPTFINTQGGPRRNQNAQIVDPSGKPIPRLYSAGELGSIYSFQYQGGGNVAECFAFGRIAGRNAAAETPWG